MKSNWSTLKKLIWLRGNPVTGGGGNFEIVFGTSPLELRNSAESNLNRLLQYGKTYLSEQGIYFCNNGALTLVDDELPIGYKRIARMKFDGNTWYETDEALTGEDDVTMTLDDTATSGQNVFGSYNGTGEGKQNFSLYIYGGSSTSNCYFRYGEQLVRPRLGSGERIITFGKSGTTGFQTDVSVTPSTFTTPSNTYIGMLPNSNSPAYTGSIIGNITVGTRLKYIPCERATDGVVGYYEVVNGKFIEPSGTGSVTKGSYDTSHETILAVVGASETVTIVGNSQSTLTITDIPNLYAINGVADEYDFISGIILRRTEVAIENGEITINALATPFQETGPSHQIYIEEGTNTISWTANVSGIEMEATYKTAAP